jgi:hypothetical protein
MLSRKQKYVVLKFFSMFSVIRGFNISIVVLAQYFTSIYILAPDTPLSKIIFDVKLFFIVVASAAAIAGGFHKERAAQEHVEKLVRSGLGEL